MGTITYRNGSNKSNLTAKTTTKICAFFVLSTLCIGIFQYQWLRFYLPGLQLNVVPSLPQLYIITATYPRPEQIPEITRLGYTLKHVPNLLWLVIEDADEPTPILTRQLSRIGVPFEHLVAPMPEKYRNNDPKPRGVSNRNLGLNWLREYANDGVFYFADDDNTYDVELFDQMRYVKSVAFWPVGLIQALGMSSPIIRNGTLSGFYESWIGGRKYPMDMAGFCVSVEFLLSRPNATMPYEPGYEEDGFLKSLEPISSNDIELLASNCTEILVWHTQTMENPPIQLVDETKYNGTNIIKLRESFS